MEVLVLLGHWGDWEGPGDAGIVPLSLRCHENSPALDFSRGILLTLQKGY